MLKRRAGHVVAAEVVLVARRGADETKAARVVQAHDLTMQGHGVLLFLPPALAHDIFELALHAVKGIAQRHIDVLVLHPVDHQFVARQGQVDAHAVGASLVLVFLLQIDTYTAGHEVRGKRFQLLNVLTRAGLQCLGRLHAVKLNMSRKLHV